MLDVLLAMGWPLPLQLLWLAGLSLVWTVWQLQLEYRGPWAVNLFSGLARSRHANTSLHVACVR